jgi:pSer/pThr/pTyr-binding forkhead associated (FHA) protein
MTAVLFLLRAAILILLWGFVIAAIVAVRHDVFGTRRRTAAAAAPRPAAATPAPPRRERPPAKRPSKRGGPPQQVTVVDGALAGKSFPLGDGPVTIGRAPDSTIVLSDDYVSTRHARLVRRGSDWVLEDLGSTNGTYLDRQRLSAPTPVTVGVPIRIGKTVLELRP